MSTSASSISRAPRPSSLADVLDLILDKGLVIDAYVRVSLAGIELLTVDARVVVASVDTYLRFAEAVNRLDLTQTEEPGIPALFGKGRGENGNGDGDGDREGARGQLGQGSKRQTPARNGRERQHAASRGGRSRNQDGDDDDEDDGGNEDGSLIGRIAERARR